jgi:predicted membrane protein (TIGR00267 family)
VIRRLELDPRYLLLGLTDGIIMALGLGAKAIFGDASAGHLGRVAINAGVFASVTNLATSLFTEQYQTRRELLAIERQLVISERGRLLRTGLFRTGRRRALMRSAVHAGTAFFGAAIPLLPALALPNAPWIGLVVPLGALFVLGTSLGRRGAGRPLFWGLGMILAGVVVTVVGERFPV